MDGPPSNPDQPGSPELSIEAPSRRGSGMSGRERRNSYLGPPWRDPYGRERLPTFGQWIKLVWPDLLTMLGVGAVAFPIYYFAPPFGTPSFPLHDPSSAESSSILPQYSYPARTQIVSNWLIAIVAMAIPIITMLLMQIWIRSFWDLNNGILGFAYALILSSAFQATVKALIGGLRPNFYDVCKADPGHAQGSGNVTGLNGIGIRKDMWTKDVCTTARAGSLRNAMQSFPSGHSTTTLAAAVYLTLYLNAKMKVFSNYHTPMWKLFVLLLPILAAVLLVGTLIVDNTHSWWDVLAGSTIGTLIALAAFRMVYASLFDWRINHIPLSRNMPFEGTPRQDHRATAMGPGWQPPVGEGEETEDVRLSSPLSPLREAVHEGLGSGDDARPGTSSHQAGL